MWGRACKRCDSKQSKICHTLTIDGSRMHLCDRCASSFNEWLNLNDIWKSRE